MSEMQVIDCGDYIKVPLVNGGFTLVDKCDLEVAMAYSWRATPSGRGGGMYARHQTRKDRERVNTFLHHLILPRKPGMTVDHKDRDTLNNRRSNLRYATTSQNNANSIHKRVISPFRGVYQTPAKRWAAVVRKKHIGIFATAEEAARARDKVARKVWGDFTIFNFPDPLPVVSTENS